MSQAEEQTKYQTAPSATETSMPSGVPYIVGNEAAERFSYYGMKAILPIFMTKYLLDSAGNPDFMSEEQTREVMGWFGAAVYATPFLGAIIADRYFGKYHTIMWLSLLYCVGHAILALIDVPLGGVEPRWILFAGLGTIALGAGGIKPCVTSHVGDQFGAGNKHLLPKIYSWFYFSINLGSTISYFLTPLLLEYWGPTWAFGVPGVLMALATFVFWMGRWKFVHIPPGGPAFISEAFSAEGIRAMVNLTPLLLFVAMFWSLFDQSASAWVLQAEKMNRVLFDFEMFGRNFRWEPLSAQIGLANPLLVLILIPIFSYLIYPLLGRFFDVTPLRKIGIGMFLIIPSFAIPALVEQRIDDGETPWIVWQLLAYVILTAAEVMVSITMLEFFYTQSPKKMKSVIMAFCMFSISIGNIFTAMVNRFIQNPDGTSKLPGASYYWFFTVAMLITACVYVVWSQFYRGQSYIQGDES
ncbi:MAG: POT family MFS transporter [Planctomycetota bacterium]